MKFLVDAQLPRKLAFMLSDRGFDTLHTMDLPQKNATTDMEINHITMKEKRVLISKDRDFVHSLMVSNMPYKLVHVNTGNMHNLKLLELFSDMIDLIVKELAQSKMVELTYQKLVIYE